jgi:hypothetical protein
MELCTRWSGDGDVCPCALFGVEPDTPGQTEFEQDAPERYLDHVERSLDLRKWEGTSGLAADQDGITRAARISPDGVYRWWLTRRWAYTGPGVHFVMLNPSTADGSEDDATIRRVTRFARDWGFSSVVVTNLFSYRATDPKRLRDAADPVGPRTVDVILTAASLSSYTVCAWGSNPLAREWSATVLRKLTDAGTDLRALRIGRNGSPWHPLYLPSSTTAVPFPAGR